jgi:hypothetical protein
VAVRSRRLGAAVPVPGGSLIFKCPVDRTAIVKELVLSNQGSSPGTLIGVWVARFAGDALLVGSGTPASGAAIVLSRFLVLHEDDDLYCTSSLALADLRVYASGALLQGDPA